MRRELDLQQPQTQVRLDARQHLLFLERLGDVVDGAHPEGLDLVVGALESADEDDRNTLQSIVLFEPSTNVHAGHLRHADIQENEIGRVEDRRFDGEPAAGDGSGYEAAAFIDNLYQTASLHDIGKVGTPDAILLKPGKLTADEFGEMKKHCALGANTLATVLKRHPDNQFLRTGVEVARSHHEKWDGSGYPDGLKGAAIPLAARIVALADFYDALTSKRCYRPAFSHEDTCRMIQEGRGTHFDPDVVIAFGTLEGQFRRIRQEMQDR